jgi:hypothetical protein
MFGAFGSLAFLLANYPAQRFACGYPTQRLLKLTIIVDSPPHGISFVLQCLCGTEMNIITLVGTHLDGGDPIPLHGLPCRVNGQT